MRKRQKGEEAEEEIKRPPKRLINHPNVDQDGF